MNRPEVLQGDSTHMGSKGDKHSVVIRPLFYLISKKRKCSASRKIIRIGQLSRKRRAIKIGMPSVLVPLLEKTNQQALIGKYFSGHNASHPTTTAHAQNQQRTNRARSLRIITNTPHSADTTVPWHPHPRLAAGRRRSRDTWAWGRWSWLQRLNERPESNDIDDCESEEESHGSSARR